MKRGFDSYSYTRQLPETNWVQLLRNLGYYLEKYDSEATLPNLLVDCRLYGVDPQWHYERSIKNIHNGKIVIHRGALTDYATIPRKFWSVIAPHEIRRPAIVHDILYDTIGQLRGKISNGRFRYYRKYADKLFRESMEYLEPQIPLWKRISAYRAVRAFGWIAIRMENRTKPNEKDISHLPPLENS